MEIAPFLADLTPAGILGLVVVMILLGWLVPVRMMKVVISGKDALIAEQKAHIDTQARALDAALRGNTATEAVLTATAEIQYRSGVADNEPAA
ncbi:MAG: hypothetical protein ACRDGM_08020 [bacterium]